MAPRIIIMAMNYLLYAVFFLSGFSALIFETVWFRQTGLMLGNSIWASSMVLASFMCGLAVGNAAAGKWGDRIDRPVRLYALLEITVGLLGFSLVLLYPHLNDVASPVFRLFFDQPFILNPLRLGISFFLLVVPTAAMGATLPLMTRGICRRNISFGRALGSLYGLNTLGAVAGALAGEILMIKLLGVSGTGTAAAAANLLAAAVALAIDRTAAAAAVTDKAQESTPHQSPAPRIIPLISDAVSRSPQTVKLLLAAAFLSGFILLALEVVWFRFLSLYSAGTTFNFALMLAVVLIGIGLGGLVASRGERTERLIAPAALLSGIMVAATYSVFAHPSLGLSYHYSDNPSTIVNRSLLLMFPVSLLSGVIFTLLGRALKQSIASPAAATGLLTMANTVGAMLGALAGGFLLLPMLGTELSFFALAAAYGAVTLAVLWGHGLPGKTRRTIVTYPLAFLFVLALAFFPFGRIGGVHFRNVIARYPDHPNLQAAREGLTETLLLLRKDLFEQPYSFRMVTNSHSMASTDLNALRYMKYFVYLPTALHPGPRRALLISYGTGATARTLSALHSLERIDVVDISRDILDMSAYIFPEPGESPLADPRLEVHIEDGRFFLQTTDRTYDLITGEPPPLKLAGITTLYSREYFQLIYDHLAPGGMTTYWMPRTQVTEAEFRSIVRAFCDVFEDCSLWRGSSFELALLGIRDFSGPVSEERFTAQWRDPVVGTELRSLGIEFPEQLGATFLADPDYLRALTASTPPAG